MRLFGLGEDEVVEIVQQEILKHENLNKTCEHEWEVLAEARKGATPETAELVGVTYICKKCHKKDRVNVK